MSTSQMAYYRRIMGAMVGVLVLAIALVRWWPTGSASDPGGDFRDRGTERIPFREVKPTSQSQERTPPPPAPLPPVVVPNDEIVREDVTFGNAELRVETPEDDETLRDGTDRATAARPPDTDARLLRNVQPNYPAAARDEEVRARVEVEVKVSKTGRVQQANVRQRRLLSPEGVSRPVTDLGYGLEEAALSAARRSRFRPARANGRPVATRKVITFAFGTE